LNKFVIFFSKWKRSQDCISNWKLY